MAAALARRPVDVPSGRHGDLRAESTQGNVGWPAPDVEPPSGGSTGWPGGMPEPARQQTPGATAVPARPRGWRRLFGARAA
ncbi:hypothetical protein [Geodermatophilus sp. CPCC 206100]|uniref:hypothetical protein n=1 Tax=Geodermatophilus sp. CPCC 206100 TaxID=3020054 RepID=UPI003AFFB58C